MNFSVGGQWAGGEAKYPFSCPAQQLRMFLLAWNPPPTWEPHVERVPKCNVMQYEPSASQHSPSSATGENAQ